MSGAPRDFPGLVSQEANADKTAELLTRAARAVTATVPNETWGDQAARLLQAATYAGVAVAELHRSVGWYEAAASASEARLLDTEGAEP